MLDRLACVMAPGLVIPNTSVSPSDRLSGPLANSALVPSPTLPLETVSHIRIGGQAELDGRASAAPKGQPCGRREHAIGAYQIVERRESKGYTCGFFAQCLGVALRHGCARGEKNGG